MKYIDLFFYTSYLFLRKLGRSDDEAKWSSMLHVSTLFTFFLLICFFLLEMIFKNSIFDLFKNYISWLILDVLILIISYFRYYKTEQAYDIEQYFSLLSLKKQKKIIYFIIVLNILIFIGLFITGKLQIVGHF
jgi:hypothetical protein